MQAFSQITLEHTHQNCGALQISYGVGGPLNYAFGTRQFYLVHLEIDGDKYVLVNKIAQTMTLYNLNYTVFTVIDYSNVYTGIFTNGIDYDKIYSYNLYISQNLFDCDPEVEFMYTCWSFDNNATIPVPRAITQIVNEDGMIAFTDSAGPLVQPTYHNQYYPIYNTTNGTKMILSNKNGTVKVYSLCGALTDLIADNNITERPAGLNVFPNPAMPENIINVNYSLPEDVKTANLVITDINGNQIKQFKIGNDFHTVFLDPAEFNSGSYFYYVIKENGEVIGSKKGIVIK
jgi:hypothetical protein